MSLLNDIKIKRPLGEPNRQSTGKDDKSFPQDGSLKINVTRPSKLSAVG